MNAEEQKRITDKVFWTQSKTIENLRKLVAELEREIAEYRQTIKEARWLVQTVKPRKVNIENEDSLLNMDFGYQG